MRAVVQRVCESQVRVAGQTVGQIGTGLLVLLGVAAADTVDAADYLADKIVNLRIFEDEQGRMNRSVREINGQVLVVSQFTLLADCRKGRRPSFVAAAPPKLAETLYRHFIGQVQQRGIDVQTGHFGAMMDVALVNNGPVTLVMESL